LLNKVLLRFRWYALVVISIFALSDVECLKAQAPNKTRILFLLDASGSMYAQMGRDNRMDVAKRLLGKMVDSLRDKPNLEIALRVYGHQTTKDKQNCKDTKLEVPFNKTNHDLIKEKLRITSPFGYHLDCLFFTRSGLRFSARCQK
jgi:Ca-activated chloride channel family protein